MMYTKKIIYTKFIFFYRRKDDEISGSDNCKEPLGFLQKAQVKICRRTFFIVYITHYKLM